MNKDKLDEKHYCDNVNCNHNNTKGLCCMFNPDNCKYRQLQKENAELKKQLETVKEMCCGKVFCPYRLEISLSEVEK